MKKFLALILCVAVLMTLAISSFALTSVPVTGIALSTSSYTMEVGKTYNLWVKFTPSNTTQKLLNYSTSNKNVATVDSKGVVTAVDAGTATITATSTANADISATLNLTVKLKPNVRISFCLSNIGWGGEAIDPDLMKDVQKVIEKKCNVTLDVIAPPQSTYNDKLAVMLAANQIPDIYAIRKAMDTVQVYAARGYCYPLNNLLKKFPNITSQVSKSMFDNVTVNGKISAVPMYVPLSKGIWLRQDMIDKYGVKLSTTPTTDEFFTEMSKMAGKGIIPFSFAKFLDNLPFFFNPFGAYYGIGVNKDGKFYDGFNTPEGRAALAYCAKLYKAKIWDQEFLTNENANMREKLFTGRAASALDYFNRYIYYSSESVRVGAGTTFVPVYELNGPAGMNGNLNEAIQDALAISPKCQNAERAMDVINYYVYTKDGVMLRNLGIEGEHYKIVDGVITPIDKATNSGYKCDVNGFFLYFPKITEFPFKWNETTEKLLPEQYKVNDAFKQHLGPKYLVPGGVSDLYDKNLPAYKAKIDSISAMIITGSDTVTNCFEDYTKFWKSIKGDDMLAQLNK